MRGERNNMAQTYNVQIEDSAGNKYCPKPDLLTTKEQLTANNTAGKSVDALVVKALNNDLVSDLKINDEGKLVVTKGGADTVLNFSGAGLKLLHIRYVVGASGYSPYGSINVQFKNESAKYLNHLNIVNNETIYGYSGTDEPEFSSGNTQYGISVPSMWTEVTGTDISMYKYIWIRYSFNTTVAKKTATFDIR